MQVGIDWFSVVALAIAYGAGQIRTLSVRARYFIFAAACAAIALNRLRMGAAGINLLFVAISGVLAVYYVTRGMRARGG